MAMDSNFERLEQEVNRLVEVLNRLRQENADLKQFMAVDKRDISRLTIDANQFSLVSEHPSDSYSILPGDTEQMKILEVTNPDTFWQISQYLVISKKT